MSTMPKEAQEHLAEVAIVLRDVLHVDPDPVMTRMRDAYADVSSRRLSLLLHEHPYQLAVELGGKEAEAADTADAFETYESLRAGEDWSARIEQVCAEFFGSTTRQIAPDYQIDVLYHPIRTEGGNAVWAEGKGEEFLAGFYQSYLRKHLDNALKQRRGLFSFGRQKAFDYSLTIPGNPYEWRSFFKIGWGNDQSERWAASAKTRVVHKEPEKK